MHTGTCTFTRCTYMYIIRITCVCLTRYMCVYMCMYLACVMVAPCMCSPLLAPSVSFRGEHWKSFPKLEICDVIIAVHVYTQYTMHAYRFVSARTNLRAPIKKVWSRDMFPDTPPCSIKPCSDSCVLVSYWSSPLQVLAYTLGLGTLVQNETRLRLHMKAELEHNDTPYGMLVLTGTCMYMYNH